MNPRKLFKIFSLALAVITVSSLWLSCASGSGSSAPAQSQVYTVQHGNLSTMITATGNLAFSTHDDLVFHITGQVAAVNVDVGDNITQGEVLAALDTTDLDEAVDTANLAVKSSQIDLQTAMNAQSNIRDQELAVQSAQIALQTAQSAQSSITAAQIALDSANNALNQSSYPYTFTTFNLNVPTAIQAVHDAQLDLNLAKDGLNGIPGTQAYTEAWLKFSHALTKLTEAQQSLQMGTGIENFLPKQSVDSSGTVTTTKSAYLLTDYFTLQSKQLAANSAKVQLDQTTASYKTGLDTANLNLTKAMQTLAATKVSVQTGLDKANVNLDNAKNNLKKAQENLAKATITAPYDGIVTARNVTGGQQINSGQVVFSIADPTKLEADVLVNEVDIPWVNLGTSATLQVDAASAINLPAKITKIAPTATVQSGVVNYTVTIGLTSTVIAPATQPGQTPTFTPRPTPSSGQAARPQRAPTSVPQSVQLRQGLSVTSSIVKEQRTGVLLIPARAIAQQGGNSYVQVIKSDGTTEQRLIQTGLADGQNTEVTSGLTEGEKVMAAARAATPTTTTPAGPGGGIRLPGGLLR